MYDQNGRSTINIDANENAQLVIHGCREPEGSTPGRGKLIAHTSA